MPRRPEDPQQESGDELDIAAADPAAEKEHHQWRGDHRYQTGADGQLREAVRTACGQKMDGSRQGYGQTGLIRDVAMMQPPLTASIVTIAVVATI